MKKPRTKTRKPGRTPRRQTARRPSKKESAKPKRMEPELEALARQHAEEALRESEQKYFLLFQRAAIPVALTKLPENVFADVNEAFEKLLGYTKQDVLGKTPVELGIAQREEHAVTVAEIERRGVQRDAEKRVLTKSGEERIVSINVNALEWGGQRYALTTMQDITEHKRAEQALHESEMRYRRLFETIQESFALLGFIKK